MSTVAAQMNARIARTAQLSQPVNTLQRMAEALAPEQVPARLAKIREQMKLLSDYL